ncbi:MAG: leucine-rich repeat domain-containing protein [Lachnospiraceae bacterium]|nr:leucine-rich repeat domain-containing protein [Lachnospiraceae bacterium]
MRWKDYVCERIEDGIRILRYAPETEEDAVSIPSHIEGDPVVEIGEDAFSEEGVFLSCVEIPSTVKRIGGGAFRMCMNLTELILHDGLERIGEEALALTPLTEITLPATVSMIETPWTMADIRFTVSEFNPYYFSDGFGLYRRENGEQELLVAFQQDERTSYEVPEGTTAIGEDVFSTNNNLQRVTLPATVHTIGEAAFEGCQNLSEIALPEGLREIGDNAFGHCIRLKSIHLPSTVEKIGVCALSDTFGWGEDFLGLERITVEEGNAHFMADADSLFEIGEQNDRFLVKYFGEGGEYRIPEDVSRILAGAFRRAKFYRCEVPQSVKTVGRDAFRECRNLREIFLAESGTELYIPAQPVYRKDEVTGLFFDREHEAGYIYDYRGYDALFPTYLNLPDRCGMACCRLKYPVLLDDETAREYCEFMWENLTDILQNIAEKQDMELLVALSELGFFTEDNIEESLDVFAKSGQTKLTGFLLNYKRENLKEDTFDFSL